MLAKIQNKRLKHILKPVQFHFVEIPDTNAD